MQKLTSFIPEAMPIGTLVDSILPIENYSYAYATNYSRAAYPELSTKYPHPKSAEISATVTAGPGVSAWLCSTYGAGKYVALNANGCNWVAVSTDLVTWTRSSLPSTHVNPRAIFYSGSLFVITGGNQANYFTSTDATTWVARTFPLNNNWSNMAYGAGVYVMMPGQTAYSYCYSSTDCITWTQRTLPVSYAWSTLTYGTPGFFALTNSASGTIGVFSTDGITWVQRSVSVNTPWAMVTWSNTLSMYVAVATGSASCTTSTDGLTWTTRTLPTTAWKSIVADGASNLVAFGTTGVSRSTDGVTWSAYTAYPLTAPYGLPSSGLTGWTAWSSYGPSGYLVLDNYKGYGLKSTDFITWTPILPPVNLSSITSYYSFNNIAIGGGKLAVLGDSSFSRIFAASTDGVNWVQSLLPAVGLWKALIYANGLWVTALQGYTIAATSTDGISWVQRTLPSSVQWDSIIYANGIYVLVAGNQSYCVTSTDAITWTQRSTPIAISTMTFGNGKFIAPETTSGFKVISSTDCVTWTTGFTPYAASWMYSAYGNGIYMITDNTLSNCATSTDGIDWLPRYAPVGLNVKGLTFCDGLFILANGSYGKIYTSVDGCIWNTRENSNGGWTSACYNSTTKTYYVTGSYSYIQNWTIQENTIRISASNATDKINKYVKVK